MINYHEGLLKGLISVQVCPWYLIIFWNIQKFDCHVCYFIPIINIAVHIYYHKIDDKMIKIIITIIVTIVKLVPWNTFWIKGVHPNSFLLCFIKWKLKKWVLKKVFLFCLNKFKNISKKNRQNRFHNGLKNVEIRPFREEWWGSSVLHTSGLDPSSWQDPSRFFTINLNKHFLLLFLELT